MKNDLAVFVTYAAFLVDGNHLTNLMSIGGKTALTVDARKAKPVALKTPDPAAKGIIGTFTYSTKVAGQPYGSGWAFFDGLADHLSTAQLGDDAAGFSTTVAGAFSE